MTIASVVKLAGAVWSPVILAVSVVASGLAGCGGGDEPTVVAGTLIGWDDGTVFIRAADAVQFLESQGIHVLSYECQVVNGVDQNGDYVSYVDAAIPVGLRATVSAADGEKLRASVENENRGVIGPLAGYGLVVEGKSWIGQPFDCAAAGF